MTTPIHKQSEGFILPLVAVFMVIISLILASMLETEAHYEALHTEFVHDQQLRNTLHGNPEGNIIRVSSQPIRKKTP